MKKIIAVLLIALLSFSLVACSDTYTDVIEQLEEMELAGYFYTDAQISAFKEENDVSESITAFANFSSVDNNGEELILYVVAFDTREDAKAYRDTHTSDWKYAYVSDNVVVYGSNSVVNDLDL